MTLPLRRADRRSGTPRPIETPDFVDLTEMTSRLSVSSETIVGLRRRRRFPEPDRHFSGQEIWWWPHVALWARQRGRSLRKPPPTAVVPVVDLVGIEEVSGRIGVKGRVIRHWIDSGRFPTPDYQWSRAHAWLWETVDTWLGGQNRRRSETPLWSRLARDVADARKLVAEGRPTQRLRKLIEEVAREELSLLGTSTVQDEPGLAELSDSEFLDRFDGIR
ncbi:MAG: hypothetical protein KJN63_05030, partial [Acidimicrobiia bacterium]|nr:hypothetical protein [Acidimicrobiia bacterium]